MTEVLVDTNVFSYLLRQSDTRADLYRPHVQGRIVLISYVTVGELYYWAERRHWGTDRVKRLEERIRATTVARYDFEVCRTYARLKHILRTPAGSQRVVGDNDLWVAACGIRYGVSLITHNRRHFEGIPGLSVISEAG